MNGKQIKVKKTGRVGVIDHTTTINGKTFYLVCFDESSKNIENGGTMNLVLHKEDAIEFI